MCEFQYNRRVAFGVFGRYGPLCSELLATMGGLEKYQDYGSRFLFQYWAAVPEIAGFCVMQHLVDQEYLDPESPNLTELSTPSCPMPSRYNGLGFAVTWYLVENEGANPLTPQWVIEGVYRVL